MPAPGQTGTSSLVGSVADPADAVVPNAVLTATELATRATFSTLSTEDGLFRFNALPPGKYKLRAQAAGFKVFDLTDIDLASSETRNVGTLVLHLGR